MKRLNGVLDTDQESLVEPAREVLILAQQLWGSQWAAPLIGRHPKFAEAFERVALAARAEVPVLITGETGTGKELFARALFLLAPTHRRIFVAVNCGQYVNDQVIASEMFGHRRGSFTGATSDHTGLFHDADGGTLFLDEIGELTRQAQTMLLRLLDGGEILPVGATRPAHVNVRVVAATNRDLWSMVQSGTFREDLFFRLHRLTISVPPLRERGQDWELIANYFLNRLAQGARAGKNLATETVTRLNGYDWPGNVRELRGCVETGFYLSKQDEIMLSDLAGTLEVMTRDRQFQSAAFVTASDYCARMESGAGDFWQLIYDPFLQRDLNRAQVRDVLAEGLARTSGSYKNLLRVFGIAGTDYGRFMDFLRHHRLKPAQR